MKQGKNGVRYENKTDIERDTFVAVHVEYKIQNELGEI